MAAGEGLRGVVPAAGEGTRLRPLTDGRPKALVEVAGRPLLAHVLDALAGLRPHGLASVVVVIPAGDAGDAIAGRFGDAYRDTSLVYARQPEPRGLADAVLAAAPHLDGPFVVVHGDNVLDADLATLLARHRATGADATLLVDEVSRDEARGSGVLAFEGAFVEKPDDPPSTTVVRGAYVLEPVALEACRAIEPSGRGEYEMAAAFDRLVRWGRRVETVPLEGACVNVNAPADVERAERLLAG